MELESGGGYITQWKYQKTTELYTEPNICDSYLSFKK